MSKPSRNGRDEEVLVEDRDTKTFSGIFRAQKIRLSNEIVTNIRKGTPSSAQWIGPVKDGKGLWLATTGTVNKPKSNEIVDKWYKYRDLVEYVQKEDASERLEM